MQQPIVPQPPKIVLPPLLQTVVPRPITGTIVQPIVPLPQSTQLNYQTGQVAPIIVPKPNVPISAVAMPPQVVRPTVIVPKPVVLPVITNPIVPVMMPRPQVLTPNIPQ